jgi:LuxR family transcriptional regulator, maltose regulon positive regulatory protein
VRTDPAARPLLTVKQAVPPVRDDVVRRERLLGELAGASARLVVVVAPAGWGKTVLLSHWASTVPDSTRLAWVTLDETDDEPVRFWRYVLTAWEHASDELSLTPLLAMLGGADPVELAVPLLVNELAAADTRHVLVLDDYHAISDSRIHEAVEFLVTYLPANASLVIASRADPPLPLARLRAKGDLAEFRAHDLRFTPVEAEGLVTSVAGPLEPAVVEAVCERTEGWAAGLQLAALRIRGSTDPHRTALAIRGDDRNVNDYLLSEVLGSLDEASRDLLVRCSPLVTLSGDLCDVALGTTGSVEVLARLEREHLFVARTDDGSTSFRCHRLVRDAFHSELRRRGDSEERAVLRRVAQWLLDGDRPDEAVQHLVLAAEQERVAALLRDYPEPRFFGAGSAALYLTAGESLPDRLVDPALAISLAYAAGLVGHRSRVSHWLDQCERQLAADSTVPGWTSVEAAMACMRSQFVVLDSESASAVELARRSTELETDPSTRGYIDARMALGGSYVLDGRFQEARDVLRIAWKERDGAWSGSSHRALEALTPPQAALVAGLLSLCLVELDQTADLDRLLEQLQPVVTEIEQQWGQAPPRFLAPLRMAAGRHACSQGDAAAAARMLEDACALAEMSPRPTTLVLALAYLAEARLAAGDRPAALAALAKARDVLRDEDISHVGITQLEEVQLRVGTDAVRSAQRRGDLIEPLTDREVSVLRALRGTATQREIGSALFLSVNTVKTYTKSLYRKLDVGSRGDAVSVARDLGLI